MLRTVSWEKQATLLVLAGVSTYMVLSAIRRKKNWQCRQQAKLNSSLDTLAENLDSPTRFSRSPRARSISRSYIREERRKAARERVRSISMSINPDDPRIQRAFKGEAISEEQIRGPFFEESDDEEEEARAEQLILEEMEHAEQMVASDITDNFEEDKILELVWKHFPGAADSAFILNHCIGILEKHGITPENTLYGQSVCPDEINHEKGDITDLFSNYLGEVFHLGGLAGIPFTGKTGFFAFSHHVPDGGNLFILFAPHVGVSPNYKIGQYHRIGQHKNGSACGAAVGGYLACGTEVGALSASPDFLANNHHDYQMHYIIQQLHRRREKMLHLSTENEKMAELALQIFHIARDHIEHIVNTNFAHNQTQPGKLILLGGIQINMPKPMDDYFLPLMFQMRELHKPTVDLLDALTLDTKQLSKTKMKPELTKADSSIRRKSLFELAGMTEVSSGKNTEVLNKKPFTISPTSGMESQTHADSASPRHCRTKSKSGASAIREARRYSIREHYRSTSSVVKSDDVCVAGVILSDERVRGSSFEESDEDEQLKVEQIILNEVVHAEDLEENSGEGVANFDQNLVLKLVEQHFPGAGPNETILNHCMLVLEQHGITPENTLYSQSVCPDEINHERGDITDLFTQYLGEVFHLGGLAGIPFTGKTGFCAFSHHVPDGGNLMVLFAPHVGISPNLKVGQYHRIGQNHNGSACGTAVGALLACSTEAGKQSTTPEFLSNNHHDYQMHYLIQQVYRNKDKILSRETENEQMEELAIVMYQICRENIEHIVCTDFSHGHGGKLILLGGLQINMPAPMSDYFLPLLFQIREQGKLTVDLLHALEILRDELGP